jgi:hypothetical protein
LSFLKQILFVAEIMKNIAKFGLIALLLCAFNSARGDEDDPTESTNEDGIPYYAFE